MNRTTMVAAALSLCASATLLAQDPLVLARRAYDNRADPAQAKLAVTLFEQAAKQDPRSYEARWEGARAIYYAGTYPLATAGDEQRLGLFNHGIEMAQEAVKLEPKRPEGHFWLGVLYGVFGETKGIFKSLSMVPLIKQEMGICLDLDKAVEGWGPDRVLGRLYFKLPFFKGGDNTKSAQHLERSLQGAPTNDLTRIYLAETYKALGQKGKAVELLRWILDNPPDPRWAPERGYLKPDAERLVKKLE